LPVLTTDVCGYACHVSKADAGRVLSSPFQQRALNESLSEIMSSTVTAQWKERGIHYGETADLYSQTQFVTDLIETLLETGGAQ